MTPRVLIIGVGNPSRGDDAAGLLVAERLGPRLPPGVTVRACSGEATSLMDAWAAAPAVILVDAVLSGAAPGTVHRLDAAAEPVPGSFLRCSTHSFGVADAIELGRALATLPQRLIIYGIEGQDFGHGTELSPPVAAALPRVAGRVLAELPALMED